MLHLANLRSTRDSEARSDEPVNEEKERRNGGSFLARFEKREEFSVGELRIEWCWNSWCLEDLFGTVTTSMSERGWSVLQDDCTVDGVIICEVPNQLAKGLRRWLTMILTD